MKTLQEINKGCVKEFPEYSTSLQKTTICCGKYNYLCPQCSALKEQMEDIIKELRYTRIACCEDCTSNLMIKTILKGEGEDE